MSDTAELDETVLLTRADAVARALWEWTALTIRGRSSEPES